MDKFHLSKSIKIKISISIIWVLISLVFSLILANLSDIGFLYAHNSNFSNSMCFASFILFNFPIVLYWLVFWVWGEGKIKSCTINVADTTYKIFIFILSLIINEIYYLPKTISYIKQYVAEHWRGEQFLGRSFWINGSIVGILLTPGIKLSKLYTSNIPIFIVLTIIHMSLLIWYSVGLYRSASIYTHHGIKPRFFYNWKQYVKIIAVLILLYCVIYKSLDIISFYKQLG